MESTGDKELLESMARGDGDALKVLFGRYFGMVAAVGGRISGDADDGKDVAQKVFISLWEKRSSLSVDGDLGGYLKRMAINEALGRKRTEVRRDGILGGLSVAQSVEPSGEQKVIADETLRLISEAIDALPEKTREVFIMSRYESMSYREIGESLGVTIKTVEYHMGKALLVLRQAIRSPR